jgi:hypothetical protein
MTCSPSRPNAQGDGRLRLRLRGGGSIGVLLGGVLTDALDWHWIFLVNLPIGARRRRSRSLLPAAAAAARAPRRRRRGHRDGSLHARGLRDRQRQRGGWTSGQTLGCSRRPRSGASSPIEAKVRAPLMPLGCSGCATSRRRTSSASSGPRDVRLVLLSALYLQLVLGLQPAAGRLAFLPANLIMACFSLGLSAKLVMRFGIRPPSRRRGCGSAAARARCCSRGPGRRELRRRRSPEHDPARRRAASAFNPDAASAAMSESKPSESGLASGSRQHRRS